MGNGESYIAIGNFYDDIHTTSAAGNPNGSKQIAYYFIDDISVTPATPSITVSYCKTGANLSALGAASAYTSWYNGVATYTGNPVTVPTPTANTTYTCTLNLSPVCPTCAPITQTTTVLALGSCSGPAATPTPAVSYTYTSNPGYVAQNILVNSNVNYVINSANVGLNQGVTITVASGGTLTINGSWLHACWGCNGSSMWQGIVVQNGGKLIINNYSIIEDAIQAVYVANNTTGILPTWSITNSIFNKNSNNIYIDASSLNLSGNAINSSVFTCRNIINHAISSTNFAAIKADISAADPLNLSANNALTNTLTGLRTGYGVYLNNLSNVTNFIYIGTAATPTAGINNVFDNMDYGIKATNSAFVVRNNRFQNITGNDYNGVITGAGVYVDDETATGVLPLFIGNGSTTINNNESNVFLNCLRGVVTLGNRKQYINNNTFNGFTAGQFNVQNSKVYGEYGVYNNDFAHNSSSANPELLQFANNTLQNYATGYFLDFNTLYGTTPHNMYITTNTITATGANAQYVNYGVNLQQSNSYGAVGAQPTMFNVSANTITNINTNCINLTNVNHIAGVTSGFMFISQNNELSVIYNPMYTVTQTPPVASIVLNGSYYTIITDNPKLTCTRVPTTGINAQGMAGVYTRHSVNSKINCNTALNTGEGFVFENACTASQWQNNTMYSTLYGLTLRSSGVMGDQGAVNYPCNNYWNYNISGQTLADGSDPSLIPTSKIYGVPTAGCAPQFGTYLPCDNKSFASGVIYSSPATLISTSGSSSVTCISGGGGNAAINNANISNTSVNNNTNISTQSLQGLTADGPVLPTYDFETRWHIQNYISAHDSTLAAPAKYTNAKIIAGIEKQMARANYQSAQNLNNALTPGNIIETNCKQVNAILLKINMAAPQNKYSLTATDIIALQNIAPQCPLSGGSIVYSARALLNSYYKTILEYPGDCSPHGQGARKAVAENTITTSSNNQNIKLYPNPNSGDMILEYEITNDGVMEITDVAGKVVDTYHLSFLNKSMRVYNDNLVNGIYLYRISNNDGVLKSGKIVIIK